MVMRIKKNDTVVVLSGKDRGKRGKVTLVLPKKDQVLVKGIALATKHLKARRQGEISGIKQEESFIDVCKVMPICSSCDKACRVGMKKTDNGDSVRICCFCKEILR